MPPGLGSLLAAHDLALEGIDFMGMRILPSALESLPGTSKPRRPVGIRPPPDLPGEPESCGLSVLALGRGDLPG